MKTLPTAPVEIIRHQSAAGEWEVATRWPAPELRGFLRGPLQGFVERATHFERRIEAATGVVAVILNLGSPFQLADPRRNEQPERKSSFVAGLWDGYAISKATGPFVCMEFLLTPLAAGRLFGLPPAELTNRVVDWGELLGGEGTDLLDQLSAEREWPARFDLLESFLLRRWAGGPSASPIVEWAWNRLEASFGRVSIAALAREAGWSRKHLAIRFREQVGLTPKRLARVLRFDHAVQRLQAVATPRWAELAHQCGYFDQAHLIRDFRQFTGATPTGYLRRLLPDGGGVRAD